MIFARYSSDVFSFENKIFYAVFENGRWEKVMTTDKRVEEEFKRLNIRTAPSLLLLKAILSGFNRRDSSGDEDGKKKKEGVERLKM